MRSRLVLDPDFFRRQFEKIVKLAQDGLKEVVYHADISISAGHNYRGGRLPALDELFRLARYAGVPMEWFLLDSYEVRRLKPRLRSVSYAEGDNPDSQEPLRQTGTCGR